MVCVPLHAGTLHPRQPQAGELWSWLVSATVLTLRTGQPNCQCLPAELGSCLRAKTVIGMVIVCPVRELLVLKAV